MIQEFLYFFNSIPWLIWSMYFSHGVIKYIEKGLIAKMDEVLKQILSELKELKVGQNNLEFKMNDRFDLIENKMNNRFDKLEKKVDSIEEQVFKANRI